jgi:hypothetical protein
MRWGNQRRPAGDRAGTGGRGRLLPSDRSRLQPGRNIRCPVFLASNKEIAMTRESVDLDAIELPAVSPANRPIGTPFLPFGTRSDDSAPDFLPIGDRTLVRQTSSTHGPMGTLPWTPTKSMLSSFVSRKS